MLTRKQNVFDDFIAAAELLVKEKYTNPARLAIRGGSNGGLLVGAALTQRPELFRAVVAQVAMLDMLRFEIDPNGVFNVTEFGIGQGSRAVPRVVRLLALSATSATARSTRRCSSRPARTTGASIR